MNLLSEFRVSVARTATLIFGSQKVIGVECFDRKLHPSGFWIMRLPKETSVRRLACRRTRSRKVTVVQAKADLAAVLRGSERAQEDITPRLTSLVLLAAPDGEALAARLPVEFPQGVADTIFGGIVRIARMPATMRKR